MAFNFPSSPTVGQVFNNYVWDGQKWRITTVDGRMLVSDTAPTSPIHGQQWFESDTGKTFLWYDPEATGGTWVHTNGSSGSGAEAGFAARNRIVNGAMQISQENGDTNSSTNGFFPADQWIHGYGGINSTSSARLQIPGPNGNAQIFAQTSTAIGSLDPTDWWNFYQPIEGTNVRDFEWGTANAKQIIVRFWITTANAPGTYSLRIGNAGATRSFLAPITIGVDWSEITIIVPGDTTGTWATDTTTGLTLNIAFAVGSDYIGVAGWQAGNKLGISGMTNGAATANAIFYLADVGLYLDVDGTNEPPLWEMPDPAQELVTCQRYWQSITGDVFIHGHAASATNAYGIVLHPNMRITPTVTSSGAFLTWAANSTNIGVTGIGGYSVAYERSLLSWTVSSGLVAGDITTLKNNGSAKLTFNARM